MKQTAAPVGSAAPQLTVKTAKNLSDATKLLQEMVEYLKDSVASFKDTKVENIVQNVSDLHLKFGERFADVASKGDFIRKKKCLMLLYI